jgi:hypothetical protein
MPSTSHGALKAPAKANVGMERLVTAIEHAIIGSIQYSSETENRGWEDKDAYN